MCRNRSITSGNAIKCLLLSVSLALLSGCDQEIANLYTMSKGDKWGYIDIEGNVIISPQYIIARGFGDDDLALVVVDIEKKNDSLTTYQYGYINKRNKFIIKPVLTYRQNGDPQSSLGGVIYEQSLSQFSFHEERAKFQDALSKKYGFIDTKGDVVINPIYDKVSVFSEGLAAVHDESTNKWGYIDIDGNLIIDYKYTGARDFSEGLAIVDIANSESVSIDDLKNGETISFDFKWFAIDKKGNMQVGPFNTFVSAPIDNYSNGYSRVKHHFFGNTQGYRFIDREGNYTTDFDLEGITPYSSGYAGVKTDEGWVFIDENNRIQSEPYELVEGFEEGYAQVKRDGKWGYIDTLFNKKPPFKFDGCSPFRDGVASFIIGDSGLIIIGLINKDGKVIWQREDYSYDKGPLPEKPDGVVTMEDGEIVLNEYD